MEKAPLEEGEPKNRNFIVNYVGESLQNVKTYDMTETNIAPVGMYCQAWDWLNNLKVGDLVDSIDETHGWFRSFIID